MHPETDTPVTQQILLSADLPDQTPKLPPALPCSVPVGVPDVKGPAPAASSASQTLLATLQTVLPAILPWDAAVSPVPARRILVAVSGGADSVALLRGLHALLPQRNLQLCVGHFDHRLRADSADDACWVQELSRKLGLDCLLGQAEQTAGSEESARAQRYAFLLAAARQMGCSSVAVAHTADDQAETVLHHLLRGTGLRGLSGMPEQRELASDMALIRPCLQVRRSLLRQALEEWKQEFREDSTNASPQYTRNRIRHSLLPILRDEVNPQVDGALLRLAWQAGDAQSAVEWMARSILDRLSLTADAEAVRFNRREFVSVPVAIVREFICLLWREQGWPRQALGADHIQTLVKMIQQGTPRRHSLPGRLMACCRQRVMEIRRAP